MAFWSSDFGTALLGALVGGLLSLLGSLLVLGLQARRENRRRHSDEFRRALIETPEWWAREKPAFEAAAARAKVLADEWEAGGKPAGRLATQVHDLAAELLRRVPTDIRSRLYWYGSDRAYRPMNQAWVKLLDLRAISAEERHRDALDDLARDRPAPGPDRGRAAVEREVRLLDAARTIDGAVADLNFLMAVLETETMHERRRLRGDARLAPETADT